MQAPQLANSRENKDSYYRSQLYTSYHGINPLVTAAHPLLSIIDRLQLSRSFDANSSFYNNLQYELKVFESRTLNFDYDEETVFIAHFILSASINEILHEREIFSTFKKLMPPNINHENTPDLQFFEILDKIIDKPEHYLDLLELIYLCLSLGFEGKYRVEEHQKLQEIMETLFQTIKNSRETNKNHLFKTKTKAANIKSNKTHCLIWLIASAIFISIIFISSNYFLDRKAMTLMKPNQSNNLISE